MNIISKTNFVEVQIIENPYNLRIPRSVLGVWSFGRQLGVREIQFICLLIWVHFTFGPNLNFFYLWGQRCSKCGEQLH